MCESVTASEEFWEGCPNKAIHCSLNFSVSSLWTLSPFRMLCVFSKIFSYDLVTVFLFHHSQKFPSFRSRGITHHIYKIASIYTDLSMHKFRNHSTWCPTHTGTGNNKHQNSTWNNKYFSLSYKACLHDWLFYIILSFWSISLYYMYFKWEGTSFTIVRTQKISFFFFFLLLYHILGKIIQKYTTRMFLFTVNITVFECFILFFSGINWFHFYPVIIFQRASTFTNKSMCICSSKTFFQLIAILGFPVLLLKKMVWRRNTL